MTFKQALVSEVGAITHLNLVDKELFITHLGMLHVYHIQGVIFS
jgi:hypothetical protein